MEEEVLARPVSRHRRPRIPADEVRARMLETAHQMAMEVGIGITLEELSMEEVIQRARVPRSSVYRLWPYKGDFVDDLLCYLAAPESYFGASEMFDPETFEVTRRTIADNNDKLRTADGRRTVLNEVIRLAAGRNFDATRRSSGWRIHAALIGAVGSTRDSQSRANIAAALQRSEIASGHGITELIQYIMKELGLKLRDPGRTVEHMITAGRALIQGLALSHALAEAAKACPDKLSRADNLILRTLVDEPIPGPGIDGQTDWSVAAYAYMALVDAFLEPDPDYRAPEPA